MSNLSLFRETIIAIVTSAVTIPALWILTAPIDPNSDASSFGLDFALISIVTAGLVMLLRSIWRQTAWTPAERERNPDDWNRLDIGDRCEGGSF